MTPWCGRRISRNAAYEACRRGELPSIHIGNRILIPRARLQALLEGAVEVA
ncbi:MAG: helix-turn-helix domain-containing protein [Thermomicrobiales bacterium]